MRKLLSVFLLLALIFCLSACEHRKEDSKALLSLVLNNEKTFITETGKAVLLKDYAIGEGTLSNPLIASPTKYTFVDFDGDKNDELVINVSDSFGYYLVLHCDGLDIYGYEFGIRSFSSLKKDGSFIGSGGASSQYYCKLSFENNKAKVTYTAINDSTAPLFSLNDKECSIEELNKYINDWNLKEPVEWIACENPIPPSEEKQGEKTAPTSSEAEKINLNKYFSARFEGFDFDGKGIIIFDKEQFLLDNVKNIDFNQENYQAYTDIYGYPKGSAAKEIMRHISARLNKSSGLRNGDTVEIIWELDEKRIGSYFVWDYVCSGKSFSVTGLGQAESFDPFEWIDVSFSGTSPYGKARVGSFGRLHEQDFEISKKENLKNGDIIKVSLKTKDISYFVHNYGKIPSLFEKEYEVKGLDT